MGFFSQLFASAIGGLVAGYFVVVGVKLQFRRQSEAALRALMIEVGLNAAFAGQMVADRSNPKNQGFLPGHPDPGWLKKATWNSQLPYVVQLLDEETLNKVVTAYLLLEPLPQMAQASERRMVGFPSYSWIDTQLQVIHQRFTEAKGALENFQTRFDERELIVRGRRWLSRCRNLVCR